MATVSRGEITITNVNDGKTPYFHTAYTNDTNFGAYDYSGRANLMPNLDFSKISSVNYTIQTPPPYVKDGGTFFVIDRTDPSFVSPSTSNVFIPLLGRLEKGAHYVVTIPMMVSEDFGTDYGGSPIYPYNVNDGVTTTRPWLMVPNADCRGKWQFIKKAFTVPSDITDGKFAPFLHVYQNDKQTGKFYIGYDIKIEKVTSTSDTATPYQPNIKGAPWYFSTVPLGENIADPKKTFPINSSSYKIYEGDMKEDLVIGQTYTITLKGTKPANSTFAVHNDDTIYFGSLKPVEGLTDVWSLTFTPTKINSNEPKKIRIFQYRPSIEGASKIDWLKIEKGSTRTPNIDNYKYLGNYTDFVQADSLNPTKYSWNLIKGADGETSHVHTAYAWSADGTDRFTKVYPQVNLLENTKNPISSKTVRVKGSTHSNTDDVTFKSGITHQERKPNYPIGEMYYRFMSTADGNLASTNLVKGETYYLGLDLRAELAEGDYVTWRAQYKKSTGSWIDLDGWKTGVSKIEGVTSEFKRFENALTIPKDAVTLYFSYQVYPKSGTGVATGAIVEFKNAKFALKSATPYTPTPEEDYENVYPTYTGTYSDFNVEGSDNPKDYTWARSMGSDGIAGKDGVGISDTNITYAQNTSGTTAPTSGWQNTVPTLIKGQYLWTKTVWSYTDNTTEVGYTVSYNAKDGNDGNDGIAGKDGVGIKSTTITYAASTSGTTKPTTGWTSTIPIVAEGNFLWTKTVWLYTDNTSETGYSVAKMGAKGDKGDSATSYWITPSVNTIQISTTKVLNPTIVTFTGYSKTGTANAGLYAGRFNILTSVDGVSYSSKYSSSANQSAYTYTVPADVKFIKARMYQADSNSILVDEVTIPIIENAEGLEIGTRNLLIGTQNFSKGKYPGNTHVTITDEKLFGNAVMKNDFTTGTGYSDMYQLTTSIIPTGTQYTLSFYAKADIDKTKMSCYFYNPNTTVNSVNNQGGRITSSDGRSVFVLSTEWTKYWVTWTQTQADRPKSVIIGRKTGGEEPNSAFYMSSPMLVEGNKPQTWMKAPEDIETAINGKEGAWVYSPTAPTNPAIGLVWVDSSKTPNQPKRWVGGETGWVALTPEEVKDLPWGEDGSSLADWVAQAEQKISSDAIINTVLGSEDFTGIFDKKANTEDLNNLASYDDLDAMQAEYERLLKEGIAGIDFSPYVTNTELEQLRDSFTFSVQQAGGVNMLKNSLGFSGTDFWQASSGIDTTQNDQLAKLGFGSGFMINREQNATIKQAIELPEAKQGLQYALSFYMNVATFGDTTGFQCGAHIYEEGVLKYTVGVTDATQGIPSDYHLYKLVFEPESPNTVIELFVTNGAQANVIISGVMYNIGNIALKWQPYPSEIYNTNVKIDINGITVKNNQTDGYTMITPQEFSGYARVNGEMERIFTLNGQVTEVKMLQAEKRITMEPISVFAMNSKETNTIGWAFVASGDVSHNMVSNT